MTEFEIIADHSKQGLREIPENLYAMCNLKMLYLEGNLIEYLPDDFFEKLPKLNWLDLRNNRLKAVPKSIAYHENLENLLLSNNYLESLPNEIGLVPKLKVLQVSQNPLIYPARKIITDGVQAVCAYLRNQYLQEKNEEKAIQCLNTERTATTSNESDFSDGIEENENSDIKTQMITTVSSKKTKSTSEKDDNKSAVITIKGLSRQSKQSSSPETEDLLNSKSSRYENITRTFSTHGDNNRIVHQITRGPSKITLRSYYADNQHVPQTMNVKKKMPNGGEDKRERATISDAQLKEHWLQRIKAVLAEQERILQQEKNLTALSEWRKQKRLEPPRYFDAEDLPKPPFDIQEEYMSMKSRSDLIAASNQTLEKYIQKSTSTPQNMDLNSLIEELVERLKEIENTCGEEIKTPRHEIEKAAQQIKTIMGIHQNILNLQKQNDKSV